MEERPEPRCWAREEQEEGTWATARVPDWLASSPCRQRIEVEEVPWYRRGWMRAEQRCRHQVGHHHQSPPHRNPCPNPNHPNLHVAARRVQSALVGPCSPVSSGGMGS